MLSLVLKGTTMINLRAVFAPCALASAVLMTGCAITQNVTPVSSRTSNTELCVVTNSEVVQDGFHPVFVQVLTRKGFSVKSLPDKSSPSSCPLTATYEAIYRWDIAIYLARVDLRVYNDGREVGQANYDSLSGSANMNKFIRTEPKLTELVDQLFQAQP
jgi:hypothetical protein